MSIGKLKTVVGFSFKVLVALMVGNLVLGIIGLASAGAESTLRSLVYSPLNTIKSFLPSRSGN